MIKTIDDLRKCYAVRADKEVFELFMDKCEELGIVWSGDGEQPRGIKSGEAVVFSGFDKGMLTHDRLEGMQRKDYKRLTLSDFKPTRTEYVQVTESIFDLRDEFERRELSFQDSEGDWLSVENECELAYLFDKDAIYRRVEKVVDERQEFVNLAISRIDHTNSDDPSYYSGWFEQLYDAGCRFVGANGEID